jgi:hypothetical protein
MLVSAGRSTPTPKLLVVAQNYKTVMALLTDSTLDVRIVETLWNAIRHLGMHEVRAAIGTSPGRSLVLVQIQLALEDVLRPKNDPGEYASVLGGRVYKGLSNRSLPFRAWGHMTAVFMCYTCARRVLFDNGDGSMADFVAHITRIWLEVYHVPDVARLIDEIAAPFISSGELEMVPHADHPPTIMPNLEGDVLKAYEGLWGTAPATLPEDDISENRTRRRTRA